MPSWATQATPQAPLVCRPVLWGAPCLGDGFSVGALVFLRCALGSQEAAAVCWGFPAHLSANPPTSLLPAEVPTTRESQKFMADPHCTFFSLLVPPLVSDDVLFPFSGSGERLYVVPCFSAPQPSTGPFPTLAGQPASLSSLAGGM